MTSSGKLSGRSCRMSSVVTYVASPNFEINLYASIHSLFQSGSKVDRVKVFSVGGDMPSIQSLSAPVEVEKVKNKNKEYFLENKTYVGEVKSEKVIYLDCDTVVLKDISNIWKNNEEFVARKDSAYESGKYFNIEKWKSIALKKSGKKGPYFNSGFFGFSRRGNRKIKKLWKSICKKEYKKAKNKGSDLANLQGIKMIEQMSLSLSVLQEIRDVRAMKEEEHVYGWEVLPDSVSDSAVVYHTGSRGGRHLKYALALSRRGLVDFNEPVISSATHPLFIKLQVYDLAYRAKDILSDLRS